MKKKVLSLAIIATSLLSISAVAQENDNAQRPACLVEECDHHQQRGPKDTKHRMNNPFEGIDLTDAQKAKLDEMRKNNQATRQKKQADFKKNREENRVTRDSLIRSGKLNHLRQIKEVLTPEQYVTFLENIVVNQKPEGRNHRMAPRKGHKHNHHHEGCAPGCDENSKR